jgi:menaquinol-cytochrome c reductase iron-sulfur subunit
VLQRFTVLFVISDRGQIGPTFSGMDKHHHSPAQPDRRNFIVKAAAVVIGGIVTIFPFVSGLFVFLDPLRRKSEAAAAVPVGALNSLKENGPPVKLPVIATRVDAWNRTANVPIGSVYVQRIGPNQVRALNVVCPHAGCAVSYRSSENHYYCPCHKSSFAEDGKILDPKSPSPRAMDQLPADIRDGQVWVTFQNFRRGIPNKVPV